MILSTALNICLERPAKEGPMPLDQAIRLIADAGFRHLDFGFVEYGRQSAALETVGDRWKFELQGFSDLAHRLDLEVVQTHAVIYDFFQEEDAARRRALERSLQGTRMLGADIVVMHPMTLWDGDEIDPKTHEGNVRFFREMSDRAAALDVKIAIENMWGRRHGRRLRYVAPQELMQLVEDIGRDNVGICWDVEHAEVEGLPQRASLLTVGEHLLTTHLSDTTGPENIHILPYTGTIDWDEVLQALSDIGYDGALDLEIQHAWRGFPKALLPQGLRLSHAVGRQLLKRFDEIAGKTHFDPQN